MISVIRFSAGMFAAVSIMALGACSTTGLERAEASNGGETAAKAAAFRYLFANNASALQADAAAYCIGTGPVTTPTNPNPELLAALSDVRPAVRPISACRDRGRVVDSAGRPALIFNLETIECDSAKSCLFQGGYHEANASGSGAMYRARFAHGLWRITQEGPMGIS